MLIAARSSHEVCLLLAGNGDGALEMHLRCRRVRRMRHQLDFFRRFGGSPPRTTFPWLLPPRLSLRRSAPSLLELHKLRMGACQMRQKERYPKCCSRCPPGSHPGDQHFGRVRSTAGQGHATLVHHSARLPKQGTFFFGQSDLLLGVGSCRGVITAEGIWYRGRGAGEIPPAKPLKTQVAG
jgi:hypothetical protein